MPVTQVTARQLLQRYGCDQSIVIPSMSVESADGSVMLTLLLTILTALQLLTAGSVVDPSAAANARNGIAAPAAILVC